MKALSGDNGASRSSLDLAGVQASDADLYPLDPSADHDPNDLQIRLPDATRLVVRVRNVVSECNSAIAGV